jgi:CubicO group peptidase (beta-lactamase class C family)
MTIGSTIRPISRAAGAIPTGSSGTSWKKIVAEGDEAFVTYKCVAKGGSSRNRNRGSELFFGDNRGWGMGLSVFGKRDDLYHMPGRFGWDGGYGTSWYSDPREQFTGIC